MFVLLQHTSCTTLLMNSFDTAFTGRRTSSWNTGRVNGDSLLSSASSSFSRDLSPFKSPAATLDEQLDSRFNNPLLSYSSYPSSFSPKVTSPEDAPLFGSPSFSADSGFGSKISNPVRGPLVGGLVGGVAAPSRLGRPFNARYPDPEQLDSVNLLSEGDIPTLLSNGINGDEVITKEPKKETPVNEDRESKDLPKPFSATPVGGSSVSSEDLIGSERRGQKEFVQGGFFSARPYHDQDDITFHSQQLSSRESVPQSYSRFESIAGKSTFGDIYFVAIIAGCSLAAVFGVMGTGYCLYKFNAHNKSALDVDYPAYGVTGPMAKITSPITADSPAVRPDRIDNLSNGSPSPGSLKTSPRSSSGHNSPSSSSSQQLPGDRKLAQNAQMYHYHHQKQQMIQSANSRAAAAAASKRDPRLSENDSDDDHDDEVDYIVYECPGLAPTGEMEVKNPLFQDDETPSTPMKSPKKD